MKKLFIITLCAFSSFLLNAQVVSDIQISPASPEPTDEVKAIVTATFPGGDCSKESQTVTQSNDTLIVSGFYCHLSASGGCTSTDTFTLGMLPSGNYTVRMLLYTSNTPAACGSAGYFLKNIGLENFTVSGGTGIGDADAANISIFPNPASGVRFTLFNSTPMSSEIQLLNINGRVMKTFSVPALQSISVETADLPGGIYFCTVSNAEGRIARKISVVK